MCGIVVINLMMLLSVLSQDNVFVTIVTDIRYFIVQISHDAVLNISALSMENGMVQTMV